MLFNQQDQATSATRRERWAGRALIFVLISASTASILFCPCDNPGGSTRSILLVTISAVFGCVAAFFIYREMRARSDITGFLKIVIASAIAGAGVYAEFTVVTDIIDWLARAR